MTIRALLLVLLGLFAGWAAIARNDEGCTPDPNGGRCVAAPTTDEGCTPDPDGRPRCVPL